MLGSMITCSCMEVVGDSFREDAIVDIDGLAEVGNAIRDLAVVLRLATIGVDDAIVDDRMHVDDEVDDAVALCILLEASKERAARTTSNSRALRRTRPRRCGSPACCVVCLQLVAMSGCSWECSWERPRLQTSSSTFVFVASLDLPSNMSVLLAAISNFDL